MEQTQTPLRSIPKIADFETQLPRVRWVKISMHVLILLGLVGAVVWLFMLMLSLGSVEVPRDEIWRFITTQETERLAYAKILNNFRLPKALTAMLAGAALGVSGLQMQTFFRNPLAGPFVLGITSGASLGVAVLILSTEIIAASTIVTLLPNISTASPFRIAIASSIGAGSLMFIVLLVARFVEGNMTLLILGLMFSYLTSAVVSLLMYGSLAEQVKAYVNWSFGSFEGVTWTRMEVFAPALAIGLILAAALSKQLNALLLGENYARSLGVNIQRIRLLLILSTSILAGTVTAFCGPIVFIGLAVPHLCRTLFGTSDHRILVPATMLVGAILAMGAALIAEMPNSTASLPLNTVTAFIGAPIVIYVILSRRNLQKSFAS